MLDIFRTSQFKSDFKKLDNDAKEVLKKVLHLLINEQVLEAKYKNHLLIGNYNGSMECHLKPDLLLIYTINSEINELQVIRIGSHARLFQR